MEKHPKHIGSVYVSTALHRFYNRWFSVKKVAGRPAVGRTLPRRSSHRHPAPPKVGASNFLSKWTLLVGVTPLRRGSCRKSSRSSSGGSSGSTSSYFLPKNSQFLMVIAFSWTDFGGVFLAIFRRKIARFWWLTNIAAYLSWIFDQNSSICYGYIKKNSAVRSGSGHTLITKVTLDFDGQKCAKTHSSARSEISEN